MKYVAVWMLFSIVLAAYNYWFGLMVFFVSSACCATFWLGVFTEMLHEHNKRR